MSVVFFGTPRFAVPSLEYLISQGEDVRAVVTRPDKRRVRGRAPEPSPVKDIALKHRIEVFEPRSMRDEGFLSALRGIRPEFSVIVAYGRILTKEIIDIPARGTINLHASLLPRYRGASPIAWAVINGEKETGLCTMVVSEGLDEGDVLLAERFPIGEEDTTETLSERLSLAGGPLLARTLREIREGKLKGTPQQGEPSYAPLLKKEDGRIDWSKPAREIYNFVRGMRPWPGAFCFIKGERVKLLRVLAVEGRGEPGRVAEATRHSLKVGAGTGLVEVLELQPEGGRPMPARDWLQGRRLAEGMRVS